MNKSIFALLLSMTALAATPLWAQQDISKVNGKIVVAAGQQVRNVEAVNGHVEIGDRAQVRNVETVNGRIEIGRHVRADDISTVNGSIRLGERCSSGGIETVNGGVFVANGGELAGGIETVNGAIGVVRTRVQGNIQTVNGDITVGVGSEVHGGLTVRKPNNGGMNLFGMRNARPLRIVIGPDAVVHGPMKFERPVVLYVHSSAKTGPISGAQAIAFNTETPPPR